MARTAAQTSWASAAEATLPVPMAHTGSYATTILAMSSARQPGERALQLCDVVRDVVAGLADVEALADAHDRSQAVLERGLRLVAHDLVGLTVQRASLGVPDHDVGAAELGEHGTGDLAGVRAGIVGGDILRTVGELDLVAVDQRLHRTDVGERRDDRDVDLLEVLRRAT